MSTTRMSISGAPGGDAQSLSEMGASAAVHGKDLWELGYTIDQVVHDYGDLCQAITDLAVERDAPFSVDVAGLGAFPNLRRPKILWAGVTDGVDGCLS